MASLTITTFNGLRCTKVPRTDVFTATLTSDAAAPAATDQSSTTSVAGPDPARTTSASSADPNSDSSTTAAASDSAGNKPAASATALPQTASPEAREPHSSLQSIRAAIGGSLGAVALVALALLIWYLLRRRNRMPRPAVDFYGGEKLGGQTGGRKQKLQEVAATLKTRLGQTMRGGFTRFKSRMMPTPVVRPPETQVARSRSNQEDNNTRTDTQPRLLSLSNPFADPLPSTSLFDDNNPFADPKSPFDVDLSPGEETQIRRSYSDQHAEAEAVDSGFDIDTRDSNRSSSSNSSMDMENPYRISTIDSESVWSRRESTDTTSTTNTTGTATARPASTRSDPFDLERPPTTIAIYASGGGAVTNRMTRGQSMSSRDSIGS